jgi:hypothetical protein
MRVSGNSDQQCSRIEWIEARSASKGILARAAGSNSSGFGDSNSRTVAINFEIFVLFVVLLALFPLRLRAFA